ncbi:hypothetical protein [Bacillus phage SPO1L3]|nr:hypothetical protein Goe9_c00760 [Bacillus phage vB_BsuM-Goe9]WIT26205.1 hypothetical protein [Bacillus phage SPO1L3]WIT26602.1 hypothetical protein [Bacillus phage SPO1L5]
MDANEMINKSLEDVEKLTEMSESLSKSEDSKEVASSEISENTPSEGENQESGAPENDDPETSQEDTDADSEGQEDAGEEEDTEKSLESVLNENESVQQSLEVSGFLQELVKSLDGVLSRHQDTISKSMEGNAQTQELLAKSFQGIVKSQQAIVNTTERLQKSITELNSRLDKVERTPIKKSVSSAKVIEKSFDSSIGNKAEDSKQQLTKSQISDKLFAGVQEKKLGNDDLLAFESTGNVQTLSAEARNYLGL